MNAIFERAAERRQRALEIIGQLNLLERWRRYGSPEVVGAVRYGLVVAADIDVEIYADEPRLEDGFAVMVELARLPGMWKVRFSNEMDSPDQGLYFGLRYRHPDGEVWKVDNWLLGHDHPHAHWAERFALALERVLTDETRRAILEIKETTLGQPSLRGIDIYKAVLRDGVRDAAAFLDWTARHPPARLDLWMPGE